MAEAWRIRPSELFFGTAGALQFDLLVFIQGSAEVARQRELERLRSKK